MFLGGFLWRLYVNSSKANSYHFKNIKNLPCQSPGVVEPYWGRGVGGVLPVRVLNICWANGWL